MFTLGKKLKDAGCPALDGWYEDMGGKLKGDDGRIVPDLSELIEACGEGFGSLQKHGERWYVASNPLTKLECGETPEIAVASLWLKLNGR